MNSHPLNTTNSGFSLPKYMSAVGDTNQNVPITPSPEDSTALPTASASRFPSYWPTAAPPAFTKPNSTDAITPPVPIGLPKVSNNNGIQAQHSKENPSTRACLPSLTPGGSFGRGPWYLLPRGYIFYRLVEEGGTIGAIGMITRGRNMLGNSSMSKRSKSHKPNWIFTDIVIPSQDNFNTIGLYTSGANGDSQVNGAEFYIPSPSFNNTQKLRMPFRQARKGTNNFLPISSFPHWCLVSPSPSLTGQASAPAPSTTSTNNLPSKVSLSAQTIRSTLTTANSSQIDIPDNTQLAPPPDKNSLASPTIAFKDIPSDSATLASSPPLPASGLSHSASSARFPVQSPSTAPPSSSAYSEYVFITKAFKSSSHKRRRE